MNQMYRNFQEWQTNSLVFSWVLKIAMRISRVQHLKNDYEITNIKRTS
jgi:hypothetical protein